MRLYDEIFKNASDGAFARCVITPCGGGYFEGVKMVEDLSAERILICFSHQRIEVLGEELSIKKYYDGDLQVLGKILSLRAVMGEG